MPIRIKLSLFYTFILMITITIFGIVLYTTQAQDSLEFLKDGLIFSANKYTEPTKELAHLLGNDTVRGDEGGKEQPPVPQALNEFPPGFEDIEVREIVRIIDFEKNLIASPRGERDDVLPLSDEGLEILKNGDVLWEEAIFEDEEMLIYSFTITMDDGQVIIVQMAKPLTERSQTLATLSRTLLLAGSFFVVFAFVVGLFMARFSLQPINNITNIAKEIGEEQDFSRRVAYEGPQDEIGQLATTLNGMLYDLEKAYSDVEKALSLQKDFIADVSHELRTPLTTIRGNLGLMKLGASLDEEMQTEILRDMIDESDRLIRLVNDLLVLARTEAGRKISIRSTKITPIIEESIRQVKQVDVDREIVFEPTSDFVIAGNRDAFKQIMIILLDNAVKHSDKNVIVSVEEVDGKIKIDVEDFGKGISVEKLAHVFDRFYRDDHSLKAKGFGLGLPISKALVEEMNGEISIDSEVGKGTKITLIFSAI